MRLVLDTNVVASGLLWNGTPANAELIVSGDQHLLDLKEYQGIPIVSAAQALARLLEH